MTFTIFFALYILMVLAVALSILGFILIYTGMTFREFTTWMNNQRLGGN